MKAIELKNVKFGFDEKTTFINNLNFDLNYGDLTLVSGSSGSGKSTFMYIISGIIPNINYGHIEGEVLVNEESIIGEKVSTIARKVGVVLQNADSQIIQKKVDDEIAFGMENFAFSESKISKQIDIVTKLMSLNKDDETFTLSGGQKQRLITASTLAISPKILIFDEPLANLDQKGAKLLMETLKKLASNGFAIIVIEHRIDLVLPYVNRIYHMKNGDLHEVFDKEEYLKSQSIKIIDESPNISSNDSILEIKNLSYTKKKKMILKDLNLDIKKGSRVLLLGDNGCGKTTLIRLIARLIKPTVGEIIQHLDPKLGNKRGSKKWYNRVGVIYQNPDYQLFMKTVEKEICFNCCSKEYALDIAHRLDLDHLLARHPQSLSEGEKRRVTIAAVLASRPDILLLDEPTVGQDYERLKMLVTVLNEVHQESGNTMITITHDVRCAEALAEKVILIEDGKIIENDRKTLINLFFNK